MVASVPSDRRLRSVYSAKNERFLLTERNSERYARALRNRSCVKLQASWVGAVRVHSTSLNEWAHAYVAVRCGRAVWWRSEKQALDGLSPDRELLLRHPHAGIGSVSPKLMHELRIAENDGSLPPNSQAMACCIFGLAREGTPMQSHFLMESQEDKAGLERAVTNTLKQE